MSSCEIKYPQDFSIAVQDPNHDGSLTAEEYVKMYPKLPPREAVIIIDTLVTSNAKDISDFIECVYQLDNEIGYALQFSLLRFSNREDVKKELYFKLVQNPHWTGEIFKHSETYAPPSGDLGPVDVATYGTFVDAVDEDDVETLLSKYDENIVGGQKIRDVISYAAHDKQIYLLLKDFFARGGKIIETKFGGRYNNESLIIEVGVDNERPAEFTLYEELLHYFYNLYDCELAELPKYEGLDHYGGIIALKERAFTISELRKGIMPSTLLKEIDGFADDLFIVPDINAWKTPEFRKRIDGHYYYWRTLFIARTREHFNTNNQGRQIEGKLENKNFFVSEEKYDISSLDNAQWFDPNDFGVFIHDISSANRLIDNQKSNLTEEEFQYLKGLVLLLQESESKKVKWIEPRHIEDVVFIKATHSAIVLEALRLAIKIADAEGCEKLEDAFASKTFKNNISIFLSGFLKTLSKDKNQSIEGTARIIMDSLIECDPLLYKT